MSKKYLLDLFTPHTWDQFLKHGANVSGFKLRQQKLANERGKPGTIFLCYLVRVSRWCGALEIKSESFVDDTPIFYESDDPFVVRFKVKPLVTLPVENSPPMTAPEVWDQLSLTKGVKRGSGLRARAVRNFLGSGYVAKQILCDLKAKSNSTRLHCPLVHQAPDKPRA